MIIVGLGLAGAALAVQLIRRGKSVVVFDPVEGNRASRVAAGLFNPVTGKLMVKTWKADTLFPALLEFYSDVSRMTGKNFLHQKPIFIPFLSAEEQNNWMVRDKDEFIESVSAQSTFGKYVHDSFGGVLLRQSGFIDTNLYLDSVIELLCATESFTKEKFSVEELTIDEDTIRYRDVEATQIVFCDGLLASGNPLIRWLPLIPLKGETLDIRVDLPDNVIFNRGVYLVPIGDQMFKVGATYDKWISHDISEKGRQQVEENLRRILKPDFQVTHQNWGIRPTTPDRRPILGQHPAMRNVFIFNGLGTKGVSQSPWLAGVLADHISSGAQIEKDVNITRYYALYSKS